VLAKETAIAAPLALAAWELVRWVMPKGILRGLWDDEAGVSGRVRTVFALTVPLIPLVAWYAFHFARTGYVFGNPEFFRYNVAATLNPLRFVLAFLLRLWQTSGYLNLW